MDSVEKILPKLPTDKDTETLEPLHPSPHTESARRKFSILTQEQAKTIPSPSSGEIRLLASTNSSSSITTSSIANAGGSFTTEESNGKQKSSLKSSLSSLRLKNFISSVKDNVISSSANNGSTDNFSLQSSTTSLSNTGKLVKSGSFSLKSKLLGLSGVGETGSSSSLKVQSNGNLSANHNDAIAKSQNLQISVTDHSADSTSNNTHSISHSRGRSRSVSIRVPEPPIPSFLTMLPGHLATHILSLLPVECLLVCSEVCLSWYGLAQNQNVWLSLCLRNNWTKPLPAGMKIINWKQVFKRRYKSERAWTQGKIHFTSNNLIKCHDGPIYGVKFDDEVITAGRDGALQLWHRSETSAGEEYKKHRRQRSWSSKKSEASMDSLYHHDPEDPTEAIHRRQHSPVADQPSSSSSSQPILEKRARTMAPEHAVFRRKPFNDVINCPAPITALLSQITSKSRIIGGLYDGSLVIWNSHNLEVVCHLVREHKDAISSLRELGNISSKVTNDSNAPEPAETIVKNELLFVSSSYDGQARIYQISDYWKTGITTARLSSDEYYTHTGKFSIKLLANKVFENKQIFSQLALVTLKDKKLETPALILSGLNDGIIKIWNWKNTVHTCSQENTDILVDDVGELTGHSDVITSLVQINYKPSDDKKEQIEFRIASGSSDKSVRVWRIVSSGNVVGECKSECLQTVQFQSIVRLIKMRDDNITCGRQPALMCIVLDPGVVEVWKSGYDDDDKLCKCYDINSRNILSQQQNDFGQQAKAKNSENRIMSVESTPFELLLGFSTGIMLCIEYY